MNIVQRSLAGGELSPSLYPRTDTVKYSYGLRTERNCWTRRDGGSENRPGFEYLQPIRDVASNARLIPMIISDDEAYVVEFTDVYFRFYKNGKPDVSFVGPTITSIANGSGALVAAANADSWFVDGTEVYIEGVKGMPEINGKIYVVSDVDSSGYKLKDSAGNYIDSTSFGAYISGGTGGPLRAGIHIYDEADLDNIQFAQSGGVLTMTCPGYPVSTLTLSDNYLASGLGFNYATAVKKLSLGVEYSRVAYTLSAPTNGSYTYRYAVTAILENGEETTPLIRSAGTGSQYTISGITKANPAVITMGGVSVNITGAANNGSGLIRITASGHGVETGHKVTIASVGGTTEANGTWTATYVSSTTFDLQGTTFANAYTSGGTVVNTRYLSGDLVYISGVVGMTEINGRYYTVTPISGTTLSINRSSSAWTTYSSGGTVYPASIVTSRTAVPTISAPNVIGGLVPALTPFQGGAIVAYNIYLNTYGVFGFIGTTSISIFNDTGLSIDVATSPPEAIELFAHNSNSYGDSSIPANYPRCVTNVQQRQAFGNFTNDSEEIILSQVGVPHNFTRGIPVLDSDAIKFNAVGKKISSIKHLVDMVRLLVFTQSGEFSTGNADGIITPSSINIKHHSAFGASSIPPIVVDNECFFVQQKGSVVRNMSFNFNADGYQGNDLTSFATHLFEGHTIVDWAYQSYPNSTFWVVRDDGILLGMTYVREQQILAWHRHDTKVGFVENVCCIPENGEDSLYLITRRTINSTTVKYIERMHSRFIDDVIDNVFMDSSKTFDGRNTDSMHTMDLSGGTTWSNTETLTLTSSTSFFTADNVGDQIFLDELDDDGNVIDRIRFTITGYTNVTTVTGKAHKTVPTALRSALSDWSLAISVLYNLDHLEGEEVSVFADGYVVANPNNDKYGTPLTVASGSITLPKCHAVIHVGLPITADLETLDIDSADGKSISEKAKLATHVRLYLNNSRGGWVGPREPSGSDPIDGLIEFKPRSSDDDYGTPGLKSGNYELAILPEWNSHGRIFIRQIDPLPISVLGVSAIGVFPLG